MIDPLKFASAKPPSNNNEPRRLAAVDLFSAAKELYVSSTLLRLRVMQMNAKVKEYSDWSRHTEAMRKMEKALCQAENSVDTSPSKDEVKQPALQFRE